MKKCVCGFETSKNEYKVCPVCGKELKVDKSKRKFTMGLSAEEDYTKEIEMTYDEALIVDKVLTELNEDAGGYCGICWINIQ